MANIQTSFEQVKKASRVLLQVDDAKRNAILKDLASSLIASTKNILVENKKDLSSMPSDDPRYDRLELNEQRIKAIADDILKVTELPSPTENILLETIRPNGLHLQRISVPLGVVGVIYEARPNVTVDVFTLCLKSGNACILKGGKEAYFTNLIFYNLIRETLQKHDVNSDIVFMMPPEREAVHDLLNAVGLVDVCIPRGSQSLIEFVRQNAKIPVIETGAGIVHTYFDASGDLNKGAAIIDNAKTRRVSVCNALDCLVIHHSRLADLTVLTQNLADKNVELFADEQSYAVLNGSYPAALLVKASPQDFGREFLSMKMAVKTVSSYKEAVDYIANHTSGHSEAIIAEDSKIIDYFLRNVDAAAVYANTSTAFTDGGQFGLGAEIGISTQKLHARGPMGLEELTSYKWVIRGDGQIRA